MRDSIRLKTEAVYFLKTNLPSGYVSWRSPLTRRAIIGLVRVQVTIKLKCQVGVRGDPSSFISPFMRCRALAGTREKMRFFAFARTSAIAKVRQMLDFMSNETTKPCGRS